MSLEKYHDDARRWFKQAEADIKAARISMESGACEWACFQSQQAGEKILKALWYSTGNDPWGHSIVKLIVDFPDESIKNSLRAFIDIARKLDKLYIPTRYPNGLPELTPSEVYTAEEAKNAIASTVKLKKRAFEMLKSRNLF